MFKELPHYNNFVCALGYDKPLVNGKRYKRYMFKNTYHNIEAQIKEGLEINGKCCGNFMCQIWSKKRDDET